MAATKITFAIYVSTWKELSNNLSDNVEFGWHSFINHVVQGGRQPYVSFRDGSIAIYM